MKIVFIIYSLGSGGAERVLVSLANFLSKKYEIEIFTFNSQDSFYPLNKKVKHKKLNIDFISNNKFQTLYNSLKRIYILQKEIKKSNPDVVISFMTHSNILSIIASKLLSKKIIISERIANDFYGKKVSFLKNLVYKFSDRLILQTKSDAKNYKISTTIIPNPINIECEKVDKENIVLAVGRLDKQKGFELLIEEFSKIDTNWRLVIAGEGKERNNLEKLIKKDNISLIGNQKDINKWYAKSSIFVLSSIREGFPNVLIEAMSCRCACISFDCPYGPSEIIENNKNGILVENQNREKLKEAIELLIKDKNLREKLANEAIKIKDKYSIEKIADRWEQVIKEVING